MTPGGMINNVSEYQFVTGQNIDAQHPHGDLDRIIIDGGIMPLRSSSSSASSTINWKNCLRGEDIAFLKEACNERMNAMSIIQDDSHSSDFCRMVEAAAVNNIATIIREIFYTSGGHGGWGRWGMPWIKNGVYPTSTAVLDSGDIIGGGAFLDAYQGYYYTLSDAQTPSNPVPDQDKVLRRSTIETMFDDISKLYCLCRWEGPEGDYIFYNDRTTPEYSSSVAIKFPTNQYISSFENFGIGAFHVLYDKGSLNISKNILIPMSLSSPPTTRDITATAFSLIGVSDYEASGVAGRVYGCVRGYFGELRSRTRWT